MCQLSHHTIHDGGGPGLALSFGVEMEMGFLMLPLFSIWSVVDGKIVGVAVLKCRR